MESSTVVVGTVPSVPGVVLVNPDSGPDETGPAELAEHFPGQQIVECEPESLTHKVKGLAQREVDFVAVAGGDGSMRCAVEGLAGTSVPLLPIPAGTRNHFARAVGIEDLETAGRVAASGRVVRVDVAEVNGLRFINTSSLGIYPQIVVTRETRERSWPKGLATVVAAGQQFRHGRRFHVTVDGRRYRAWMVFVGNGPYGRGLLRLNAREALDCNLLDFRLARADSPFSRTRVVLALVFGGLDRSPLLVARHTKHVELEVDRPSVEVALDGEVQELTPPLRYRSLPGALAVLVPDSEGPAGWRKMAER
jgi:diacylglycerol kinase family enzyme